MIIKKAFEINEQIGNRKINGIPNSNEKFMSFSIGNLKFIESMQIMLSSLESLVNNMYDKQYKYKHFTHMKKFYPKHIELLCHTNTYPYKFVYHISKLDHVGLPPKEAFYASLYQKNVSDKNYEHALLVFKTMLCVLLKDYHLINQKTDVLLLADVFENFRSMCISDYKLDPAHYMSSPG